ncbi:MAG: hypothetical protein M0R74_17455, partial [Dehalococcoidia bacterium]|nr:hypothetical protein [Dehalococcoidia bacterium]
MTPPSGDARAEDWLPVGQEPHPVGSITHLLVLKWSEVSLVCLPTGDIDAHTEPASGLYRNDTRYLSQLRFSFGGVSPMLLDAREVEHGLSAVFCNPTILAPTGQVVAAQTLTVRRKRVLTEGLSEMLVISNYGREAVDAELRLDFDADFHDIFEVRGFQRVQERAPVEAEVGKQSVTYRYLGGDGFERRTLVRFGRQPDRLTAKRAVFRLSLQPRELITFELNVMTERGFREYRYNEAAALVRRRQRSFLEESTQIVTDDERVNALINRSLLDLHALGGRIAGTPYIAAGSPWFDCLFGRDSLITGMELLAFRPELLAAALRILARYQATDMEPARDSEPGKIPHELRWGELANTGEVPFGRYYGSVDVTPLFIVALYAYWRWTGDEALVSELWPCVQQAYAWCVHATAQRPDGFL